MMARCPLQGSAHGTDAIVIGVDERIVEDEWQPVPGISQKARQAHSRQDRYLLLRAVA